MTPDLADESMLTQSHLLSVREYLTNPEALNFWRDNFDTQEVPLDLFCDAIQSTYT